MIKLKKILYPTDFSEESLQALKYAISFSKEYRAKLVVMHVVNEKILSEGLNLPRVASVESILKEMIDEAARHIKTLIPVEVRSSLDWESVILQGSPHAEILRYAKEQDVDLIIIGTHGRSGFEHVIFGSTAERVVRRAPCPVLCVKPEQREFVMPPK